jgi:anthranilate phosphoribosyltransferase
VYAEIMRDLGRQRAWAVHGTVPDGSGMDEVSILGPTRIVSLSGGQITETLESIPLPVPLLEDLKGGDAKTNAAILEGIYEAREDWEKLIAALEILAASDAQVERKVSLLRKIAFVAAERLRALDRALDAQARALKEDPSLAD